MQFPERLIQLRTQRGLSQEELAAALNVSRQTIGKWENGQVQPELPGLLAISRFFAISLDALVKGGCCELSAPAISPDADFVAFLLRAKRSTYAAHAPEGTPCRPGSRDLSYAEGSMSYLDSYFGGNSFHGQETVWESGRAIWCMNYSGRTLAPTFSGDFLKRALQRGTPDALIAARSFSSKTATPTFAEARDLLNGSAAPKPFSLGNNSYTNVGFTADGCAEAFPKEPYGVLSIHQYLFAYYKGSPKWRAFYSVTYNEKAPRAEKLLYQRKKEAI